MNFGQKGSATLQSIRFLMDSSCRYALNSFSAPSSVSLISPISPSVSQSVLDALSPCLAGKPLISQRAIASVELLDYTVFSLERSLVKSLDAGSHICLIRSVWVSLFCNYKSLCFHICFCISWFPSVSHVPMCPYPA